MDSDKDYESAIPDNCGVDFNPDECDDLNGGVSVECGEGDEECLERRRKSMGLDSEAVAMSEKSRHSSLKGVETDLDETSQKKPSMASRFVPDPPFEGLPKDYYKKKYRPDYPADLEMKRICAPKSSIKKGAAASTAHKLHPKAVFVPSDPSLATLQKRATEGKAKSIDSAKAPIWDEPSPLEQNRIPPAIISSSDEVIIDWLEEHNIQMMLEYFLALCVTNQPDEPWTYLTQLCDKMMEARKSKAVFDSLPRILAPEHIEAIFRIYDRIENGSITVAQYKSAMEAMGLNKFSTNPAGADQNAITKDTFVKEATAAMTELLRSFMINETFKENTLYDDDHASMSAGSLTDDMRRSGSYGKSDFTYGSENFRIDQTMELKFD